MAAETGADFRFIAVHLHSPQFIWCLLGPDSLIKRGWDETTSPASVDVFDVGSNLFSPSWNAAFSSNLQSWLGHLDMGNFWGFTSFLIVTTYRMTQRTNARALLVAKDLYPQPHYALGA